MDLPSHGTSVENELFLPLPSPPQQPFTPLHSRERRRHQISGSPEQWCLLRLERPFYVPKDISQSTSAGGQNPQPSQRAPQLSLLGTPTRLLPTPSSGNLSNPNKEERGSPFPCLGLRVSSHRRG